MLSSHQGKHRVFDYLLRFVVVAVVPFTVALIVIFPFPDDTGIAMADAPPSPPPGYATAGRSATG